MGTIKSYTDIEQSKKLAEILPIESADMKLLPFTKREYRVVSINDIAVCGREDETPAWSLASLLEQLPYEVCDDDGNSVYLQMNKEDDVYQLVYEDPHGDFENIETDRHEHFVDACVSMILKLNELKLL